MRCYYASPSRLTATLNLPVSFIDKPVVNVTPEVPENDASQRGSSARYRVIGDAPYTQIEVNVTDTNQIFKSDWARDASVRITGKTR